MAIYRKLHEIQKSIRAMKKNEKAFQYDYLKGDTLLSVVRPMMDEKGLLLIPEVEDMRLTPVTYQQYSKAAKQVTEVTEMFCELRLSMTWTDTEDGESVTMKWASTGQNGFDKSFGSALTYGERYYLLKLFHIATDRDDVDAVNKVRDEAIQMAREQPRKKVLMPNSAAWNKLVERMAAGEDLSQKVADSYEMNNNLWLMLSDAINAKRGGAGGRIQDI